MPKSGFVYVMANPAMPDLYKVGCTSNSPDERALGLSHGSGVPARFRVLCFSRFDAFQAAERELHAFLAGFRYSQVREFFDGPIALREATSWLYHHPQRLAFEQPAADLMVADELLGTCGVASVGQLLNPWKATM